MLDGGKRRAEVKERREQLCEAPGGVEDAATTPARLRERAHAGVSRGRRGKFQLMQPAPEDFAFAISVDTYKVNDTGSCWRRGAAPRDMGGCRPGARSNQLIRRVSLEAARRLHLSFSPSRPL